MADAVWLDVLPTMDKFGTNLVKESTKAATTAGNKAGQAWSNAVSGGAKGGAALVADLESAARKSAGVVQTLSGKISDARGAERAATAAVVTAEQRLIDARAKYGDESNHARAAELKLEAARDKAEGTAIRYRAVEDQLKASQREHREVVGQLEKATKDANDEAAKGQGKFARLKESFSSSSGEADKLSGSVGDVVVGLAAAAGAVELVKTGLENAWDASAGVSKLEASLALTETQSAAAGVAAGNLFADAWGDSMGDASDAVGTVISSIDGMRDASAKDLEETTRLALAFGDAFGVDVSESARDVGILIKNGLAPDAVAGFDLMTGALQQVPVALRGEVVDAVQEYSASFGQLGIDGASAMGLIVSATENGQYGIDKMGDSIKEFTIRATDMSSASKVAFDAIGLDQQTMANKILAGGQTANDAMGEIVAGLKGIQDPAEQAQAAIALFGTPLEDLGTDKIPAFLDSLTPATQQADDFAGAAGTMADKIGETVSPLDQFQLGLQGAVTDGIEPLLAPAAQVLDWLTSVPGAFQAVAAALAVLAVGVGAYTVVQWAMNAAIFASPIAWIIVGIAALVAAVILAVQNWDAIVVWLTDLWESVAAWFTGLWSRITSGITSAWGAIRDWFSDLWSQITGGITRAWDLMKKIMSWTPLGLIVTNWDAIIDFFGRMPARISSASSGLWNGLTTSFKSAINSIIRGWNNLELTIGGATVLGVHIPSVTLGTPNIPLLADGGTAVSPGWAIVGEAGPELLHLPTGAQVVPLSQTSTSSTKVVGAEYSGTVYVVDPEAFARRQAARTRDALVAHTGVVA